jgi:uncharacterized membrane protein
VTGLHEERIVCGALVAVGAVGTGIAIYLTVAHAANAPLACSTGGFVDCGAVTSSSFSVVWGSQIPISLPGIGWFAASGLLAAWGLREAEPGWLAPVHAVWALLALAFVIYLLYAELVVINRICAWCTVIHGLVLLTFVLALRRLQLRAVRPPTR